MRLIVPLLRLWLCLSFGYAPILAQEAAHLPETKPLTLQGDLSAQMVAGIDAFLTREVERSIGERAKFWHRDFSSSEAYEKSIEPNQQRFRQIIGAVDIRLPVGALEIIETTAMPAKVAETAGYAVFSVRWPVFARVWGEGLWLKPRNAPAARMVAVPDAGQTPEMLAGLAPGLPPASQFARILAEQDCEVLVPLVINREDTWSGNERLQRFTNQPHREWIYRPAYELGRHPIGYEVQKILAAVEFFKAESPSRKVGVAGYGEGGLLALYASALDRRIDAALVSGYFDSRQHLWEEPIYRNVFGLLREFGDAEIASMIFPRTLIVEHSESPRIDGPPAPRSGRRGAAPGKLSTPDFNRIEAEMDRARKLCARWESSLEFVFGNEGRAVEPGSKAALEKILMALGSAWKTQPPAVLPPAQEHPRFDPIQAQKRQIGELIDFTQDLLRQSESNRKLFFWEQAGRIPTNEWRQAAGRFREDFWNRILGKVDEPMAPLNPRSRKILETTLWTGYEIVLDVWADVFSWGILLVPKNLEAREKRPVVICQHGLEGVPMDTITRDPNDRGFSSYQGFAARLADEGFIVFAPHNPYRGRDKFRVLQRKANPLGLSLFSIIIGQHEQILRWLGQLPYVDAERMAFYGLSYGGKTAMRVPAVLDGYCLSICSGDFNEWITKNATVDSPYSYVFTEEYEMPEFNLGQTFNYAELAALISPRPFMVERGHRDGVAPDEWVAYEYAKVRRWYAELGLPQRTRIEFFNGPHRINGVGTFAFLREQLRWTSPKSQP